MGTLTLRTNGPASAYTVWERYADPAAWSTWAPQIQRVDTAMQRITASGIGVVRAGLLPRPTLGVPFEVLSVDEPAMEWSWQVVLGPVRLRLEHGVIGTPAGSETWLLVQGPPPLLLAYAPVARLALGRLVRG